MFKSFCAAALLLTSSYAFSAFDTTPPTNGAMGSSNYRNLFAETGRPSNLINAKLNDAYAEMFEGDDNAILYFEFDNDESYIKTIDSNDVRSEGMSWAMTIAVMLNKREKFDKLWNFTYKRMRNTSGRFPGTFSWQLRVNGNSVQRLDPNSAPDGELYMAFALFNAAGRWGNKGINYEKHANEILVALKNHLMDKNEKQILFSPLVANTTNPSYHIPAFYDFFAKVAQKDKRYWSEAADASRTFLQNHFRQTNFGLSTYLADFSGQPKSRGAPAGLSNPGDIYEVDAWRVAMNVGADAHFSGVKSWHTSAMNDLLDFFKNVEGINQGGICGNGYSQKYNINGTHYKRCNNDNFRHDVGQTATNAVATLASTNRNLSKTFIDELWNASWPKGKYRYYHANLYMLGLLHASGKFRFYFPDSYKGNNSASNNNSAPSGATNSRVNKTTLTAFKDAFIRGGSFADRQYGKVRGLAVKNSANRTFERRAVMAFDRSRIGRNGNRTIVKATLRLRVKSTNASATSAIAGVFGISNNWQESGRNGVTYNRLSEMGTRAAVFVPKRANNWINVDVTDHLKNASEKTRSVFLIRNLSGDAKSNWEIYSRESAFDPELVIEWR